MKYYKKNAVAILKKGEVVKVVKDQEEKERRTKAMALIWAGVPELDAWKAAGFREPSKMIGTAGEMRQIREQLDKMGVTPKFIANMMFGWMTSDDPKIQIAGYEKIQKVFQLEEKAGKETPTRRITLEEFIAAPTPGTPLD